MGSGGSAIRGSIGKDGGCRGESGLRRCRDDSTPVFLALCVLYVTFALGCGYDLHDSTSDFGFDIHILSRDALLWYYDLLTRMRDSSLWYTIYEYITMIA